MRRKLCICYYFDAVNSRFLRWEFSFWKKEFLFKNILELSKIQTENESLYYFKKREKKTHKYLHFAPLSPQPTDSK